MQKQAGSTLSESTLTDSTLLNNFSEKRNSALRKKTLFELLLAYMMFSLMKQPLLSQLFLKIIAGLLKIKFPGVKWLLRQTLYQQFCGGQTPQECLPVIKKNKPDGVFAILDYSVEGQNNQNSWNLLFEELKANLKRAENNPAIPFCVFKMTGLCSPELLTAVSKLMPIFPDEAQVQNMRQKIQAGTFWTEFETANLNSLSSSEKDQWLELKRKLSILFSLAHELKVPLMVDAEETWLQAAMDYLILAGMMQFNSSHVYLFNTLQMYRHDRLEYLKKLLELGQKYAFKMGLKLVRGAYWEQETELASKQNKPSPLYAQKEETDLAFDAAVELCMKNHTICAVCVGTHNLQSLEKMLVLAEKYNIAANHPHLWNAQLLGMSDDLSFALGQLGYQAAKYVPYGPIEHVFPYLSRRVEENKGIQGQSTRELDLIKQELKARFS